MNMYRHLYECLLRTAKCMKSIPPGRHIHRAVLSYCCLCAFCYAKEVKLVKTRLGKWYIAVPVAIGIKNATKKTFARWIQV